MLSQFLEHIAEYIVRDIFQITNEQVFASLTFFIADTVKIFILLIAVVFLVSIIRSFLPPDRIRRILAGKNLFYSSLLAAIIGVFTPFCTCSAIPLFLGFIEVGVPIGATFSFLIASPMVNEVALALLFGMFGYKIALLYAGLGLTIAIVGGLVLGRIGAQKWIIRIETKDLQHKTGKMSFKKRLIFAKDSTKSIVKKVWLYIIIGIAVGSIIHGYVPVDFLGSIADKSKWYAVPMVVLLGVPLYSNAAGIVPLISVLTQKGVAIGTVLAFMMAVTGLSFPEFMILKRVMRLELLVIFATIVALGILSAGYIFNAVL